MTKVQKVYTKEFKEEAVRLAQTSGKPITQVAREFHPPSTKTAPSHMNMQEAHQKVS